jgi:hypothetical protein
MALSSFRLTPLALCLLVYPPAVSAVFSAAEASKEETPNLLDQWLSDLGSDDWNRRESAQEQLLKQGVDIAPRLEEACRSGNLELAIRAKYLLLRIDPRITEFQILKVELGDRPRIADVAAGVGSEGKELVIRFGAGQADGTSFTLNFRSLSPRQVEVQVTQWASGASRVELKPPMRLVGAVSVLKRSEECLYPWSGNGRRTGVPVERERFRYVTLLRLREGRKSVLEKTPLSSDPTEAHKSLVGQLFEQAKWEEPGARAVALELLGELRAPGAAAIFRSAPGDARSRRAALLGLGERDLLLEVLREEGVEQDPALEAQSIRAATLLVKLGDQAGCEFLLRKLVEANPTELHPVVAALADAVLDDAMLSPIRGHFLETVLSEEVMSHAAWEDMETEYLFSAAIDRLDVKNELEKALALAALGGFERLARGDLGPVNVRLRSAFDLWLRAAKRLADEDRPERRFFLAVIPGLSHASLLADAMALLEEAFQGLQSPLENEELTTLTQAFVQKIEAGDAGLAAISLQCMVRFSRIFSPRPGQLRLFVESLVKAIESTTGAGSPDQPIQGTQAYLKQAEEELIRWTGVQRMGAGPAVREPPTKAKPATPSGNAALEPVLSIQRVDLSPFKEWLEDPERGRDRERELVEIQSTRAKALAPLPPSTEAPPEGTRLVFYEFDLLLQDTRPDGNVFEVLDGRRLEAQPSSPSSYVDRWGNRLQLRLEPDGTQGEGRPKRWRMNGRSFVFAGIPLLGAVQGRDLSSTWYETSDVFLGSRPILKKSTRSYRSLTLLLDGEETPPPGIVETKALWTWFLERHLLNYAGDAGSQEGRAVIGVLRTLKIKECASLLRRLFSATPTLELARHLYEVGDESGLDYLHEELKSANPQSKLRAALLLVEMGRPEGIEPLLATAEANPAALRTFAYQVLNAVDSYLRNPKTQDPGRQNSWGRGGARERAMDFLFARLGDALFQARVFLILQRETGQDFGFSSGPGAAREGAVERARAWWAAQKK